MSERDLPSLLLMLEMIEKIERYTHSIHTLEEFEKDEKTFDACLMDFIVIGELVISLSTDFLDEHSDIEWYKIRAFRNFAAHQYFGINPKKVWEIIQTNLPDLKTKLKQITNRA